MWASLWLSSIRAETAWECRRLANSEVSTCSACTLGRPEEHGRSEGMRHRTRSCEGGSTATCSRMSEGALVSRDACCASVNFWCMGRDGASSCHQHSCSWTIAMRRAPSTRVGCRECGGRDCACAWRENGWWGSWTCASVHWST